MLGEERIVRSEMNMSTMSQAEGRTVSELEISGGVCCAHFPDKAKGEEKVVIRRRRKRARVEGAEMKKRRLSEEQVRYLEMSFWKERKLESGRKAQLATDLGIDPKQVAVWFQNRRARSKSKQLEEEYSKLRSQHESTILQKCHLETEILKLKEELSKAREEIRKLSGAPDVLSCGGAAGNGGSGEMSSSSPSTASFSMDNTNQGFQGSMIEPEGEELVYMYEYDAYVNMLDLMNLYGM